MILGLLQAPFANWDSLPFLENATEVQASKFCWFVAGRKRIGLMSPVPDHFTTSIEFQIL